MRQGPARRLTWGHERAWRRRTLLVLQLHCDVRHLGLVLLPLAGFVIGRQRPILEDHEVREAGAGSRIARVALDQLHGWLHHGEEGELDQVPQPNPRRLGQAGPRVQKLHVTLARLAVGKHVAGLRTEGDDCVRLCTVQRAGGCCRGAVCAAGARARARRGAAAAWVRVGRHTCAVCEDPCPPLAEEPAPTSEPAPSEGG